MKEKYGIYGMGDYRSKEWFIYDREAHCLFPGLRFKTKEEAYMKAEEMSNEKNRG